MDRGDRLILTGMAEEAPKSMWGWNWTPAPGADGMACRASPQRPGSFAG